MKFYNRSAAAAVFGFVLLLLLVKGVSAYSVFSVSNPNGYDLTNYSVELRLNSSNFDFSGLSSCGQVFVTDPSGNDLPFWIENCDLTSQKINLWVKVPSISSGGSAEVDVQVRNETEAGVIVSSGLVAWYKLNGDATDSSGNGYDGTVHGATPTTDRFGNSGKAMSFDGSDDYIDANPSLPVGNDARTISTWFKYTASQNSNWVSWGANSNNQLSQLGEYNNKIGYLGYGNDLTVDPTPYRDGEWHMMTVTFDGSTMILFIDGVAVNQKSTTLNTESSTLNIGRAITGSNYFEGGLDDVRIYNRALTSGEVWQLYTTSTYNNGNNVFEFFDDFNGAELDTEKWSWQANGGSYTLSNGEIEIEDGNLVSTQTFNPGVVLTIREKIPYNPQGDNTWRGRQGFNAMPSPTFDSDTYAMTIFYKGDNNQFVGEYDGSNWDMTATSISTDSYRIFKLVWSSDGVKLYQDESLLGSVTSSKNPNGPDRIENRMWEGGVRSMDWVFVRKLADQEPTVSFEGFGEDSSQPSIVFKSPANGFSDSDSRSVFVSLKGDNLNSTYNCSLNFSNGDYSTVVDGFAINDSNPWVNLTVYPPIGSYSLSATCAGSEENLSANTSFSVSPSFKVFVGSFYSAGWLGLDFSTENPYSASGFVNSSIVSANHPYAVFPCSSLGVSPNLSSSACDLLVDNVTSCKYPLLNLTVSGSGFDNYWGGVFVCEPHEGDSSGTLFDGFVSAPPSEVEVFKTPNSSNNVFYGLDIPIVLGVFRPVSVSLTADSYGAHILPLSLDNPNDGFSVITPSADAGGVITVTTSTSQPFLPEQNLNIYLDGDLAVSSGFSFGAGTFGYAEKNFTIKDLTVFKTHELTANTSNDFFSYSASQSFTNHFGIYNFSTLDEKNFSSFNFSHADSSQTVLVCSDGSTSTKELNGSVHDFVVDCVPSRFDIRAGFGNFTEVRSYHLSPGVHTFNTYLIDLSNTAAYQVKFVFEGLENWQSPRVDFEREGRVIMSEVPDLTYSVSNYFLPNYYYSLTLYSGGGEARGLGNVLVDAPGVKVIRISPFALVSEPSVFKSLRISYNITPEFIRVQYADLDGKTRSVAVTVSNSAGEVLFHNSAFGADNVTFTYSPEGGVDNSSFYEVVLDVDSEEFGSLQFHKELTLSKGLSSLGVVGGDFPNFLAVGLLILIIILLAVLQVNLTTGVAVFLSALALFKVFGWLTIDPMFVGFAIAVGVVVILGESLKGGGLQ